MSRSILFYVFAITMIAINVVLATLIGRRLWSEHRVTRQAAPSAVEAVCAYLVAHNDTLAKLTSLDEASPILKACLARCGSEQPSDRNAMLEAIITSSPDTMVGLAALTEYCTPEVGSDGSALCSRLVEQYPDTRVSCMALDMLLQVSQDGTALCDSVIERAGGARVASFALLRKGERLAAQQDMHAAEICWLKAWRLRPQLGEQVYNKLALAWQSRNQWMVPLIIGGRFLDEPAWGCLQEYLLQGLQKPESEQDLAVSIFGLINAGEIEQCCHLLSTTSNQWDASGLRGSEAAIVGLSVFLLGGTRDMVLTVPAHQDLRVLNHFNRCRAEYLTLACKHLPALPPDFRAACLLRAVDRLLEEAQVREALKLLVDSWKGPDVSKAWRERLFVRYTEMLINERNQLGEAIALYKEYMDSYSDAPVSFTLNACALYYRCGQYDLVRQKCTELFPRLDDADSRAETLFMSALCLQRQNQADAAREEYAKIAADFSGTTAAPLALTRIVDILNKQGEYDQAKQYAEELVLKYPQWKGSTNMSSFLRLSGSGTQASSSE